MLMQRYSAVYSASFYRQGLQLRIRTYQVQAEIEPLPCIAIPGPLGASDPVIYDPRQLHRLIPLRLGCYHLLVCRCSRAGRFGWEGDDRVWSSRVRVIFPHNVDIYIFFQVFSAGELRFVLLSGVS